MLQKQKKNKVEIVEETNDVHDVHAQEIDSNEHKITPATPKKDKLVKKQRSEAQLANDKKLAERFRKAGEVKKQEKREMLDNAYYVAIDEPEKPAAAHETETLRLPQKNELLRKRL